VFNVDFVCARIANTSIAKAECRTCGQPLKDSLASQVKAAQPMPLLENIAFLKDQVALFDEMLSDANRSIDGKQQALISLRHRIEELQSVIRTQKQTLRSEGNSPSAAAIRERLIIEDRITRLESSKKEFNSGLDVFKQLATQWSELQAALHALKADNLTISDKAKLNRLRESFIEQLAEYGFRSFEPKEILISYRNYRPIRDENELWGMSASDTIRTIWAYLVGLLEISRKGDTNHLGLLILDEPRQQSADKVSFRALLKRVANTGNQQVIFATSEDEETLKIMLKDLPHELKSLPKRILEEVAVKESVPK
jgi:hypothetical protein